MTPNNRLKKALLDTLSGLMTRYKKRVPDVEHIMSHMISEGIIQDRAEIINDHIAFRTFGVPHLGIQSLSKIFLAYGYTQRNFYRFDTKKLNAYWFSPPKDPPNLPRIFISECCVDELSQESQTIIHRYTDTVTQDPVDALDLSDGASVDTFLHTPLWKPPTWEDYATLLQESEYAAWVLYNRYYLNHFTITVQPLPEDYNTIECFNIFLERIGIKLNSAGGKIKRSADGLLIQSSTVAQQQIALFPHKDGITRNHDIAGSYVEFAERRKGRDGFEVGNADKIFESTFSSQLNQDNVTGTDDS